MLVVGKTDVRETVRNTGVLHADGRENCWNTPAEDLRGYQEELSVRSVPAYPEMCP